MKAVTQLDVPEDFALTGSDGIYWLESNLARGIARFPLARDREGRTLDLGLGRSANREASHRASGNRTEIAEAMGLAIESVRIVEQVHGGFIRQLTPDEPDQGFVPAVAPPHEADGMVSTDDRVVMAVSVADCAAIAICGERGRALLHCGWRGLTTDMIERAVEMVDGLEAVIGPCIGPCCFEVGLEVADRLGVERTERGTVDIAAIAARRLEAVGAGRARIAGVCTRCNPGAFFSFRGQGASAGRQMAFFSAS